MSHPSLARRPLSSTEELEKLEQSITLTLQEIDRNFSKAHHIVTSSILPVVEQYGEHCRSVWDASKFWKQFFEAAANVSLSGYEELAVNEDSTVMAAGEDQSMATTLTATTTTNEDEEGDDSTSMAYNTPRPKSRGEDGEEGGSHHTAVYHGGSASRMTPGQDDSMLTDGGDGDLTGSTPRAPATQSLSIRPQFADMRSPYETLRREMQREGGLGKNDRGDREEERSDSEGNESDSSAAVSALLAERTARLPDMSMTPRLSLDERDRRAAEEELAMQQRQKDPLLHRVLDKTYRIQATPHKTAAVAGGGKRLGISPMRLRVEAKKKQEAASASTSTPQKQRSAWQDDSPMSSPEMAVPQLRSAAFLSPVRAAYRNKLAAAASGPRTPGVSVQTPVHKSGRQDRQEAVPWAGKSRRDTEEITWESSDEDGDGDLYGGMSPPKTISFALPPSKLLQTPAREASKRIVEDILLTAGEEIDNPSEYSPTMVKMNANILDDTF